MIKLAFCLQSNAVVHSEFAYRNDDLKFYCSTPGCALPVFPKLISSTGTTFFTSQDKDIDGPHISTCMHLKTETCETPGSKRSYSSRPSDDEDLPKLIPTALLPPQPINRESMPKLSRRQIAELMTEAVLAEVPGTLDDIVEASSEIYDEHDQYPLTINGVRGSYRTRIRSIDEMEYPWRNDEWLSTIVVVPTTIEPGKVPGYWMLREQEGFDRRDRRIASLLLGQELRVDSPAAKRIEVALKESFRDQTPGSTLLFWLGSPPDERGYLRLAADIDDKVALRQAIRSD